MPDYEEGAFVLQVGPKLFDFQDGRDCVFNQFGLLKIKYFRLEVLGVVPLEKLDWVGRVGLEREQHQCGLALG